MISLDAERKAASPGIIDRQFDGLALRLALIAATHWLEQHSAEIDRLNVFSKPDYDTGRNLCVTMQAALWHMEREPATGVGELAAAARGAVMGARGDSGGILAQFLHMAKAFKGLGPQECALPPKRLGCVWWRMPRQRSLQPALRDRSGKRMGLAAVCRKYGATGIVPGGQTMNPSAAELLEATGAVNGGGVIILPNNRNVILAARQAVCYRRRKSLPRLPKIFARAFGLFAVSGRTPAWTTTSPP